MMKILILICSSQTPIEQCDASTAISAARGPEVENMSMCGLFGQAQLADSAIGPVAGEYEKIVCSMGGAG